jgi:hypothetical protein
LYKAGPFAFDFCHVATFWPRGYLNELSLRNRSRNLPFTLPVSDTTLIKFEQ